MGFRCIRVKKAALPGGSRAWKWGLQAGFFLVFLLLFVCTQYPWRAWLPYRLFLDLDPLTPAAALFSGTRRVFLPAALFLLVGLLSGRLFCGYACPLGFLIDLVDAFRKKKSSPARKALPRDAGNRPADSELPVAPAVARYSMGKNPNISSISSDPELPVAPAVARGGAAAVRGLQWVVLGVLLLGIPMRNTLAHALDPVVLLTRAFTLVFYPLAISVANFWLGLFRPLAEILEWDSLTYLSFSQPAFYAPLGSLVVLLAVFCLCLVDKRFWCRVVCPLGALLGLLGRVGVWRRRVAETCIECGRCAPACPMGAIGEDPRVTDVSLCIQCRTCAAGCPVESISFPVGFGRERRPSVPSPQGLSRRVLLAGLGAGGMVLFLTRVDPRVMKSTGRELRPPGAIPEEDFLGACIRCGACVRICVTHTLQSSGMEDGLIRWGTPVPNLRFAGCEQQCDLCGRICPTGAIRALPLPERQHAKMGTAVLSRERCVAWAEDRLCLLCDEACPYNAIVFRELEGHKRPFVDAGRCNGCGMCEQVCPVRGEAAVMVLPHGELRLKTGSYREALNRQRVFLIPQQDFLEHPSPPPVDRRGDGGGGV